MELRVLRYFLAVVDTGSTSGAASMLSTSQPSLARQIRQLEVDLGTELFERTRGRLQLSDAGRRLVPSVRDVVIRAEDLRRQASADDYSHVSVTVTAPLTTITDVIAPFLASPQATGLNIVPREGSTVDPYGALGGGEADLVISSVPVTPKYSSRVLLRPLIWAYLPSTHKLALRRSIDIAELSTQELILLDRQHGTRRLFEEAAAHAGVTTSATHETSLPVVAQALAAAGRGVAVVSDEPRFGLRRLKIRSRGSVLRIPLYAAWNATRYTSPLVERFADALGLYCQNHFAGPPR